MLITDFLDHLVFKHPYGKFESKKELKWKKRWQKSTSCRSTELQTVGMQNMCNYFGII